MAGRTAPGEDAAPRRGQALLGICLSAALVWVSFADFAVIIPTLAGELAVTLPQLQVANNVFGLTAGVFVLAGGRLCDAYGRRRMLELGLVALGLASLLGFVVPGYAGLVASRALMGCASAFVLPATLSLIPSIFSGREQSLAFGAWMGTTWTGQAGAPAIGGLLADLLGWRSVFWVTAPLAAVAWWLVRRGVLRESRDPGVSRHVDLVGLLTSGLAFFCLIYGCSLVQDLGFTDPVTLALLGAALVFGVVFVLSQRVVAEPLMDLVLFSYPAFRGSLTANGVMNAVFTGVAFLLALYLQDVLGYSVLGAGLLLLPPTVTILLFIPVGGWIESRIGPRAPVAWGLVLLGAGILITGWLGRGAGLVVVLVGQSVAGTGLGMLSVPMSRALVAGAPARLAGSASGVFKESSMLGGAFGVAVFAAVQRYFEDDEAVDVAMAAGLSEEDALTLANSAVDSALADRLLSTLPPATRDVVVAAMVEAHEAATGKAIWLAGLVAVASAGVVALLWRPYRRPSGPSR
ncbi:MULTISPECIES: MFS transporter [unclassified Streptomyces]|uniref:MFS transporter n=1 Tax=unclassified Streptomyces TaxID=2593676 RepID=UPI001907BBBF|nr:MFS transporter [Streptomyces sp. HSG2]